jgi:deoxyribonuclease-4
MIEETGVNPNLLYLETMGKVNCYGDFPELLYISQILNTRVCVDWAHLYARYMARNSVFSKSLVRLIINSLENTSWAKEQYFHLSGMEYDRRGEVRHIPLEKSEIPWKMILDELMGSSLAGRIILESGSPKATDAILVNKYLGN